MTDFQPWTRIDIVLDSVARIINYSIPACPPVLDSFYIILFPSYLLPPPHHYHSSSYHLCPSLTPTTHLISWRGILFTYTLPTTATCQPMTVISEPRTACLLFYFMFVNNFFAALVLCSGPCQPLGVILLLFPSSPFCNRPYLPM